LLATQLTRGQDKETLELKSLFSIISINTKYKLFYSAWEEIFLAGQFKQGSEVLEGMINMLQLSYPKEN